MLMKPPANAATGVWAAAVEEAPAAAADKKYVTDPSTGKVVVAPQYGGTFNHAVRNEPAQLADTWFSPGGRLSPLLLQRGWAFRTGQ